MCYDGIPALGLAHTLVESPHCPTHTHLYFFTRSALSLGPGGAAAGSAAGVAVASKHAIDHGTRVQSSLGTYYRWGRRRHWQRRTALVPSSRQPSGDGWHLHCGHVMYSHPRFGWARRTCATRAPTPLDYISCCVAARCVLDIVVLWVQRVFVHPWILIPRTLQRFSRAVALTSHSHCPCCTCRQLGQRTLQYLPVP